MRTDKIQIATSTSGGFMRETLTESGITLLRLAGLSALLGLIAGAGARVYAQSTELVAAATTGSTAQSNVVAETTAVPQPEEVIYQVLPPETMPSAPGVLVVAKSSVPPDAAANGKLAGKKGKKPKKEKPPKLVPVQIVAGTLTVDGWTGKARLNYDIADLKYIYVWAPGIGTIVASNQKFPMGTEQKNAFSGNTLTLDANGHTLQISSDQRLLKDKKPASAWVYLDKNYKAASRYPEMGYGATKDAPYAWPGAKDVSGTKGGKTAAPPLPPGMRPMMAKATCVPAGPASTTSPKPVAAACPAPLVKPGAAPSPAQPVPLAENRSVTTTAQAGASANIPIAQ